MKINSKHYILIIFALVSITLAACGYLYMYSYIITQGENYSKNLEQITIQENRKLNINELSKTYSYTLSDRARLLSFILNEEEIVNFIKSIESVGTNSSSNIILSAINNEDLSSKEKGTFGYFKGHIDIKGSWNNIMRALILIENLPYIISINNINFNYLKDNLDIKDNKSLKNDQWGISLDIDVLTIK